MCTMLQTCILMVYFFFIIPRLSSFLFLHSPRINHLYHLVPFLTSHLLRRSFRLHLSTHLLNCSTTALVFSQPHFLLTLFYPLILFLFFSFGLIVNDLNSLKIYYLLFLFSPLNLSNTQNIS